MSDCFTLVLRFTSVSCLNCAGRVGEHGITRFCRYCCFLVWIVLIRNLGLSLGHVRVWIVFSFGKMNRSILFHLLPKGRARARLSERTHTGGWQPENAHNSLSRDEKKRGDLFPSSIYKSLRGREKEKKEGTYLQLIVEISARTDSKICHKMQPNRRSLTGFCFAIQLITSTRNLVSFNLARSRGTRSRHTPSPVVSHT